MDKRFIIFFLSCLIFTSLIVGMAHGSLNCWQEGCSDLNLPGGSGYTGYASNQNNILPASNISYSSCDIGGASFAPVTADFNGDSIGEFLVIQGTDAKFYSQDCTEQASISFTVAPDAQPVVMNSNGNSLPEAVILTNHTVDMYEWDSTTDSFLLIGQHDFWNKTNQSAFTYLSCSRNPADNDTGTTPFCVLLKRNSKDIIAVNILTGNITYSNTILPGTSVQYHPLNFPVMQGFPQVKTSSVGSGSYTIPVCLEGITTNDIACLSLNESGSYSGIVTGNIASGSGAVTNVYYLSAYIAKMGALSRIFVMVRYKKTFDDYTSRVYDTSWNQLYSSGTSQNVTSNWMVGDYNKNGASEACHVINDSTQGNSVMLECYDTNFLNRVVNINVTGIINLSTAMVMADFYPGYSSMGIGTVEGIFQYDGLDMVLMQPSGYQQTSARNGSMIVVNSPASGSPIMAYTDSTVGFFMRNTLILGSCGNGICDSFESCFSCAMDCACSSAGAGVCLSDADCPISYPSCVSNKCVSGFNASQTCNFASDCPYDKPVCYAHYCVQAVSGNFTQTGASPIAGTTDVDSDIQATLGILLGTGTLLKFIVGICIILAIMIGTAKEVSGSPIVVVMTGVMATILVTVLGLIPAYILVLIVLISIMLLIFSKAIFPAGG